MARAEGEGGESSSGSKSRSGSVGGTRGSRRRAARQRKDPVLRRRKIEDKLKEAQEAKQEGGTPK